MECCCVLGVPLAEPGSAVPARRLPAENGCLHPRSVGMRRGARGFERRSRREGGSGEVAGRGLGRTACGAARPFDRWHGLGTGSKSCSQVLDPVGRTRRKIGRPGGAFRRGDGECGWESPGRNPPGALRSCRRGRKACWMRRNEGWMGRKAETSGGLAAECTGRSPGIDRKVGTAEAGWRGERNGDRLTTIRRTDLRVRGGRAE